VNFIAHVLVALAVTEAGDEHPGDKHPGPDPGDLAFGAALPDLASLAGLHVAGLTLPAAVQDGVALHHRTDAAFHALPDFTAGVRRLRADLSESGLATGPCRAVAHAGWELLLDGCLLGRAGVEQAFAEVLDRAPDVAAVVSPADPERWRQLLVRLQAERWWLGYREPENVARAMHRRLRDRPRLAFDAARVELVAEALERTTASVEVVADTVLGDVVDALT